MAIVLHATHAVKELEGRISMTTRMQKICMIFLGVLLATGCTVTTTTGTGTLRSDNVKMGTSKDGEDRSDHKFKKGETVWLAFDIKGFKQADDGDVWVQEDLDVTAPDGKSILHKENILDLHQKADKGAANVHATNEISLPKPPVAGTYTLKITLRDKIGNGTQTSNSTFVVE